MKLLSVFFITICFVTTANATITENWESGLGTWECYDDKCNNIAIIVDGTTPDTTHSFRFTFPQGFPDGNAPERVKKPLPDLTEVWSTYNFKYSANWDHHPILDKQLYIMEPTRTLDMIFGLGWYGERQFAAEIGPSTPKGWNRAYQGSTTIQYDRWYQVTIRVKLNTYNYSYDEPGCSYQCKRSDGILQVWLKDLVTGVEKIEINSSNACYRITNDTLSEWSMAPVWGGECQPGESRYPCTKKATDFFYIDKISVSSTDPRGGSNSKAPNSPKNLSIN